MNYSDNILIGRFAKATLEELLKDRKTNNSRGYFIDGNKYIAYDNSTFDCWVEEFSKEENAICWLGKYFEISEENIFNAERIDSKTISISNNVRLVLDFKDKYLTCSEV